MTIDRDSELAFSLDSIKADESLSEIQRMIAYRSLDARAEMPQSVLMLYEVIIDAIKEGETIQNYALLTLLETMGPPKYTQTQEWKLLAIDEIFDIREQSLSSKVNYSLRNACAIYIERLRERPSDTLNGFERKALKRDADEFYLTIHKALSRGNKEYIR